MDMCTWRGLPVIVRLGYSTRTTLPQHCSCTSRAACCVVVACLPYTLPLATKAKDGVRNVTLLLQGLCCCVGSWEADLSGEL